MTADVTPDRRVTERGLGSSDSAFVDGSRLFWALPSPVHERSGSGPPYPTGYKLMRSSHTVSRPSPGNHVTSLTARTNTSRSERFAPGSPPSSPLRAASGGGLRPALTAAATRRSRSPTIGTKAPSCAPRSLRTTKVKPCPDQSHLLTTRRQTAQSAIATLTVPVSDPGRHRLGSFCRRP